ncbi:MAG: TerD family protein [Desulfovibrio sp.]|jgi:stress response protein SCP2|nr:TerD family protein [Desulfovibrio sp.]
MAITLQKGQGVSLKKTENDLSEVTIGLGWDVAEQTGFLNKLFNGPAPDYDLDAVAFLLGENGKVASFTSSEKLKGSDIIFYNNKEHPSGAIWLTGDNLTGAGEAGGDDEQIIIKLEQLPSKYRKILLIVQIYEGIKRKQNFANVKNAFIRAVDKKNIEMCRFDLSGNSSYADCHSMVFAEIERQGSEWKFTAIGKPYQTDRFLDILKEYI